VEQDDNLKDDECTLKINDHTAGAGQLTTVSFAAPGVAKAIISRPDDYILAMHPSERALAMGSTDSVSQDTYLKFLAENVLPWTDDEREKLTSAMRILDAWLCGCGINTLGSLVFIKTTGQEMWNCAYTRSNAMILPEGKLRAYSDTVDLARLLAHEYFHILTRTFPGLRSELYRLIGFHPLDVEGFDMPEILKQQMLTNPDAPRQDHYARLCFNGNPVPVIPVTLLNAKAAPVDATRDILDSLKTRLLVITKQDEAWAPLCYLGRPRCLDLHQVTGWRKYAANSENMIFDAEEILADCFVGLLTGEDLGPATNVGRGMASIVRRYRCSG
jgi:hypothetical protein